MENKRKIVKAAGGYGDFECVLPGKLFVGSRFFDARRLRARGITAVLRCMEQWELGSHIKDGIGLGITFDPDYGNCVGEFCPEIEFVQNGMPDDGLDPGKEYWHRTMDEGLKIIESGGVLLVHCAAGQNRGPGNCYAVLRALGYGGEAWKMITDARAKAEPRYIGYVDKAFLSWR